MGLLDVGVGLKVTALEDVCALVLEAHVIPHDGQYIVQEGQGLRRREVAKGLIEGEGKECEFARLTVLSDDDIAVVVCPLLIRV
jgi:hypothetical protein